jgi:hypothetical protein
MCRTTRLAAVAALLAAAGPARAGFITLSSGSGGIGAPDPNVWVQGSATPTGPSSGWSLARPVAVVPHPAWTSANINALWISPTASGSGPQGGYEYFVEFALPDDVASVSLSVAWRNDDLSTPMLNGQLFTAQVLYGHTGPGSFADPTPATFTGDVTGLTHAGTNRLSFLVGNAALGNNPTGLQFEATVTYSVRPVPAPPGLVLAASGILGVALAGVVRKPLARPVAPRQPPPGNR